MGSTWWSPLVAPILARGARLGLWLLRWCAHGGSYERMKEAVSDEVERFGSWPATPGEVNASQDDGERRSRMSNEQGNETKPGLCIESWEQLSTGDGVYVEDRPGEWLRGTVTGIWRGGGGEPSADVALLDGFYAGYTAVIYSLNDLRLRFRSFPPPAEIADDYRVLDRRVARLESALAAISELGIARAALADPTLADFRGGRWNRVVGRVAILTGFALGAGLAMGAFLAWWVGTL